MTDATKAKIVTGGIACVAGLLGTFSDKILESVNPDQYTRIESLEITTNNLNLKVQTISRQMESVDNALGLVIQNMERTNVMLTKMNKDKETLNKPAIFIGEP